MDSLQIVVLAIVQGITEFLPISSSGHLILVPYFTNWPDQGLEFDLAVHIGTLTAIVAYFREHARRDGPRLGAAPSCSGARSARAGSPGPCSSARSPREWSGLLFRDDIETTLRSPLRRRVHDDRLRVVAIRRRSGGAATRNERSIGWLDVVVIGCAQALCARSRHVALRHHDDGGTLSRPVTRQRPHGSRFCSRCPSWPPPGSRSFSATPASRQADPSTRVPSCSASRCRPPPASRASTTS